jgi:hypothetical protein
MANKMSRREGTLISGKQTHFFPLPKKEKEKKTKKGVLTRNEDEAV